MATYGFHKSLEELAAMWTAPCDVPERFTREPVDALRKHHAQKPRLREYFDPEVGVVRWTPD